MTRLPESTARRYGRVFDEIAAEYDRRRPTYPDELVDQACRVAGIAAMRRVAPDIAADWPTYRDLDATLAGMEQRRGNVSEVWAWLGCYDIGQDHAGPLFGDVQAAVMPKLVEHTPDELNAVVRT